MTLAHNCAVLGLKVDFDSLYYGGDPDYFWAVQTVCSRVEQTLKEAHASRAK